MRYLYSILIYCLTSFLFTSCIKEEQPDDTPENNFEALWQIIDRQYCFLDYKAEAYGLDWNEVYGRYRPRISSSMTSSQLFEVLCEMLAELRDGHVNLYSAADVGRYWSWHEDYPTNFNEEIHRLYLGTDYRIASGIKYKILDDNIGYIYYESFCSAIGDGNLDEVMNYMSLCNGLIVDVRNNSGGTLTYAERLASRFTNETRLSVTSPIRRDRDTVIFPPPKQNISNRPTESGGKRKRLCSRTAHATVRPTLSSET